MLVDLGRNDIGRVCDFGTVRVKSLMHVERYSHVMHLVSSLEGQLKEGLSAVDAFCSCFPAGTLSGAPKIRAMEIIEELEPTRRGIYGGSVFYADFSGNFDSCIAIRSMLLKGEQGYIQAGGGIVADSVPEEEYEESVNKAKAVVRAVERARAAASKASDSAPKTESKETGRVPDVRPSVRIPKHELGGSSPSDRSSAAITLGAPAVRSVLLACARRGIAVLALH